MQARALRVPEVCVNHTPPSCLVAYPFTKMEYRVLNTLVLPDPWLTQEGPVTFPACALYQLFVRSCDLAHDGLHCSRFCFNTTSQLASASLFGVCVRHFLFSDGRASEMCGRLLAPLSGITLTRATHSLHYTLSNSYMMIRSPRLCSHWPPHRSPTAQRSQAPCPAHSYHTVSSAHKFLRAPLAMSTGEAMPTSLAEALTQLSFLEFLQRCNLLSAPLQPTQLLVTISLLDAAVQTTPPSAASQDVSTQTSDRPVSSLSLDAAAQTP